MTIQTNTSQSGNKVLIVDDETAIARAMEVKFQKSGINAHAVFGGEEGWNEIQTGEYHLVLLDLMMPGMNGWEILEKIKDKNVKIKVLVTSNLSQEEDKKKAKSMGAVDFIVKSDATLAQIEQTVKQLL